MGPRSKKIRTVQRISQLVVTFRLKFWSICRTLLFEWEKEVGSGRTREGQACWDLSPACGMEISLEMSAELSGREAQAMRNVLAKYIIEQARQGEREQRRLREGALLHFVQISLGLRGIEWANFGV
jgi:hypothetical protein